MDILQVQKGLSISYFVILVVFDLWILWSLIELVKDPVTKTRAVIRLSNMQPVHLLSAIRMS